MRLRESVTGILVAFGAASAFATWTATPTSGVRGDRLAELREPADFSGEYRAGVARDLSSGREIVVRNSNGTPVYVSDPTTATTTVLRGTSVPPLDNLTSPTRSSLERAYASAEPLRNGKGDRMAIDGTQ